MEKETVQSLAGEEGSKKVSEVWECSVDIWGLMEVSRLWKLLTTVPHDHLRMVDNSLKVPEDQLGMSDVLCA